MRSVFVLLAAAAVVGCIAVAAYGKPSPTATPTVLTAVVRTDGTLARGISATASSQMGVDGYYEVDFNRDVTGCTYVATGGVAAATDVLDDADVFTVSPRLGNPNAVAVLEYDTALGYDSYSTGFHLVVVC